jgi:putative membrane protein
VSDQGPGEAADAARRTRLANERTYLAWWRTGVAAIAVGVGAGKLVPVLSAGSTWPYTVLGIGFSILGVSCSVYGFKRQQDVDKAISQGDFEQLDSRVAALLSGAAALLGLLLAVVLLVDS